MTLRDLIANLQSILENNTGDLEVYATHGASGVCSPVGTASVQQVRAAGDDCPIDLDPGTEYVNIYIGN